MIISGSATEGFAQMIATGDVSGDGIDDLIIGAPSYGSNLEGAVYVVYGTTNWDATLDVSTSAQVILLTGDTANSQIGSDLIIADLESTGTNDIYTIDASDTVIKLSLSGGSSLTDGEDGEAGAAGSSFSGSLAGGSCQLNTSASSRSELFWTFLFIFIVIIKLRNPEIRKSK
ncbi:MAG: hypothetical protein ACD_73C00682G0001 [uncultured bacterium]|nr:MAG: hypothetical protein ACD_73C00682G0001 [uncultured bacterium]